MSLFLVDRGSIYSYEQLLRDVNEAKSYFPIYKGDCLYDYFLNLIVALTYGQDVILLDSDLNIGEALDVREEEINKPRFLSEAKRFSSFDDLLNSLKASMSHLTIFTSGTTGQPKQVNHSLNTLTRAVRVSSSYANQVWAFAYNPTHMAGIQVFFQALENCNVLVNVFHADREYVLGMIERYQITHISATPTFYRLLQPCSRMFSSVVRVTLGGEKSDADLYKKITGMFPNAKLNNVYASTEAGTLFAAHGDYFQIPSELRSKIKIKDTELLIHKSLLGRSSSMVFDEGYYHSGDLVEWVDEEKGLFRFASRKNELINVGGYKVNPFEVECVLSEMEGVLQVVVFGRPNSILGNVLCAEVKLEEGAVLTEQMIRQYLGERLQDFKIPRIVKFVKTFSLTRTGKIKRS